ncbi:MAG: hypothetical protein ABI162_04535 [Luteolibacter sp.]
MIPLKDLTVGCAVIAILTSACFAENTRKIAFRTLCLDRVNGIERVVIPGSSASETQKVELYTDVSPVIDGIFKNNEAAFYIEKPPGPDGKPVLELVGRAPIGKSEHQLFLFSPGAGGEGKLPYDVMAFDDDTKTFAMGSVRAINLAPVPVRFMLSGELTPQIPPTKYALFPHSKKVNDYNLYPVVIEFLSGNGEWVNGQSVSWKATERRRDIVITSVDTQFKQPTVRMFTDFPPWMEAPEAPTPR